MGKPVFVVKKGAQKGREPQFIGFVELWTDNKIKGWALRKDGTEFSQTNVILEGDRRSMRAAAKNERHDLLGAYGVQFGGFEVSYDRVQYGEINRIFFEETSEDLQRVAASAAIDKIEGPLIKGWAADKSKTIVDVDLVVNGIHAKTVICDIPRPELFGGSGSRSCIGFALRIPGYLRGGDVHEIDLQVSGNSFGTKIKKRFGPLRVLIVSESEAWEDASRYYRCDNLKLMLNMNSIEASVIGFNEFQEKDWSTYDVVVMARVKMNDDLEKKIIRHKRDYKTVFIYEIDDLIFLPWHFNDMGSVRSGVDVKDDPNIRAMFASRLRALKHCDFGITTTPLIAECLGDLGLNTITIPNTLRIEQVEESKSRKSMLSVLCMAGSPTHFADFAIIEHELRIFLDKYRNDVSLTLLGRFKEDQAILKMPNVKCIPRQTYTDMLNIIGEHDVCLVPLETTVFNHAKSCLKYVECGSRLVPIIASATDDYVSAIRDGENGLLARKPGDWLRHLEALLSDRSKLRKMGDAARRDVLENYTVQSQAERVAKWFVHEVAA